MELSIKHLAAVLKNVNNRKESHGDERILAIDLDIEADVPREMIDQFSVDKVKLSTAFWDKDGKPKYPQLGMQAINVVYENHRIQITEQGMESKGLFADGFVYSGCKVKKIKFDAKHNGIATLRLQAQMTPQSGEVPFLLDLEEERIVMNLEGMTPDMIDQMQAKDAPAEQDVQESNNLAA